MSVDFNVGSTVSQHSLTHNSVSGGLMVWGRTLDGSHKFARSVLTNEENFELYLKPGKIWQFYAMGWVSDLNGNTVCGSTTKLIKNISNNSVSLSLSSGACSEAPFGTDSVSKFKVCQEVNFNDKFDSTCTNVPDNTTTPPSNLIKSIGFEILAMPTSLKICKSLTGSNLTNGTVELPKLPLGDSNTSGLMNLKIKLFKTSNNCTTTSNSDIIYELNRGLSTQGIPRFEGIISSFPFEAAGDPPIKVVFSLPICEYNNSQAAKFNGGDGSNFNPYQINNKDQLLNAIELSDSGCSFKLTNNIDLTGYTKGSGSLLGNNSWTGCTANTDTFMPIGSSCVSNQTSGITGFQGIFDGNFYAIKGINQSITSSNVNSGMFHKLNKAIVKNLKLIKSDMTSSINPAGGAVNNSTYTGTLAGESYDSKIYGIVIENTKLNSSEEISIGGLIGYSNNDRIENALVDGRVNSSNTNQSTTDTGGIIGTAIGLKMRQSRFEGYVEGKYITGGLVGHIKTESTDIKRSYVHGLVKASLPQSLVDVGGILGKNDTNINNDYYGNITHSYFFGNLKYSSSCNSQCDFIIGAGADNTNFYPEPGDLNELSQKADDSTPVKKTEFLGVNSNPNLITEEGLGFQTTIKLNDYGFHNLAGDIPRLEIESHLPNSNAFFSHPCRKNLAYKTISDQISSGRGSTSNPIFLCNRSQIQEMGELNTDHNKKHYSLINYIYMDEPILPNEGMYFEGSLSGNNRGFLGFTLNNDPAQGGLTYWWYQQTGNGVFDPLFLEPAYLDGSIPGDIDEFIFGLSAGAGVPP